MEDFHYRFPLDPRTTGEISNLDDLLAFHLRELLDLTIPLAGDRDQRIESFRLLNNPERIHPIATRPGYEESTNGRSDPNTLDIYEPRIGYIQRLIESLLSIVEVEKDGQPVTLDGFRLRHLRHWLAPNSGASDILAHAASRCHLDCRFCYNKGSHPPLVPQKGRKDDSDTREILSRIDHYAPHGKWGLFHQAASPCDSLDHPHIREILTDLRQKTDEPIRIPTHGSTLTPAMIEFLAELAPVSIDISLNSASPERRQWLMKDRSPQIALCSLSLLRAAKIPYTVIIVPWPFPSEDTMMGDLENTIEFAAEHDTAIIQISLPGYTRRFSDEMLFDHEKTWQTIKTGVMALRNRISCPIVLRPGIFEEYDDPDRMDLAHVIGVVENSPARQAGLLPGDDIQRINGLKVKDRCQALFLLDTVHRSDLEQVSMDVTRNGCTIPLDLNLKKTAYPYAGIIDHQLGIVFPFSGIPGTWFENIEKAVGSLRNKEILILSSYLVAPYMTKHLPGNGSLSTNNIHLRVPPNRYFGGNIVMGDLLVVQDYIEAIDDFIRTEGIRPDLALLPSSPFHLSGWGRDVTGRVYLDIERHTNIRVALVECDPIYD